MSIPVFNKLLLNLLYVYFARYCRRYKYAWDSMSYSGLKNLTIHICNTNTQWLFTGNIWNLLFNNEGTKCNERIKEGKVNYKAYKTLSNLSNSK